MWCWLIFFMHGLFIPSTSVLINIFIVIIGNDSMTGFYSTVPMYDVILTKMKEQFPMTLDRVNKVIVWKSNATFCDPTGAEADIILSEVYNIIQNLDGFSIIFSPGCTDEISTLGDLARELNVPLLASSSIFKYPTDIKRYSTSVSFSPSGEETVREALIEFLDFHNWKSVSVVCDGLCENLNELASVIYHDLVRHFSAGANSHLRLNHVQIDLAINNSIADDLKNVKRHSPVIILLTTPQNIRQIMITAYHMNMTNGSSIFLFPQSNTFSDSDELEYPEDNITSEAFKSLLIFSCLSRPWKNLKEYTKAAEKQAETIYNFNGVKTDIQNTYAISVMEAITVLFQTLNETINNSANLNTENLIEKLRNRTFTTASGSVVIGSNGIRIIDTTISRLDPVTKTFKVAWLYSFANKSMLTIDRDLSTLWPGRAGPPLDGTNPDDVFSSSRAINPTVVGASIAGIAGSILAVALVCLAKRISNNRNKYSSWWRLEPWRVHQYQLKEGDAYGIELAEYDGDVVWIQMSKLDVSMDTISSNKVAKKTLAEIRATHHENIGKLYGIAIHDGRMELLWQHDRGSLRTVLDDEKFPLDIGMKTSLIFEILTGLQVIHNSALRFHGMLSSLNSMIDVHYSIKLCAAGSSRIFSALTHDRTANSATSTDLWLAPEMLSDNSHPGSREADIYAAAIVICEIITSGSTIVFDLKNSSSIIRTLSSLTSAVQSASSIEFSEVPHDIRTLISQSFSFDIRDRPKLSTIISAMNKYFQRQSVMDRMLQRFQQYSEDLEITVHARTHELEAEGQKVNALLEEMIPPSLVRKLRNKEIIPAEGFECVTIFFSSLIDFGDFCSKSTPLMIVELLNQVYNTFDTILSDFDVYKVETIKDGYMVASGVPLHNENRHAHEICAMALEFLNISFTGTFLQTQLGRLQIRIGIHSGTVAAGVVGLLMPRYCLFGDTVNTASRMESHGEASRIHISSATQNLIKTQSKFTTLSRGFIPIKGKGEIETFWLSAKD